MKALLALVTVAVLSGCSMFGKKPPRTAPVAAARAAPPAPAGGVERVPFQVGVSSVTVEQLAKAHACSSAQGAGRVTAPGPVEVYRMQCADGKVFMARCELRQCRKM